ncbi:LysR substrate-binding protein (plasmid) [Gemmatirosa kalamazoonensis]|uniref:LysR substrate-binding protein n=1 Tax=Gemmatirosa kalamazoonensis TaxID=861299 RepID=W0RQ64_9BACT|nr:LysR family transcriptional regulator [Gemmatirosa kalamazoonensis]AHG92480.1 LysR substrate-binding protein [Gemmatirosa kalamazoonensis]
MLTSSDLHFFAGIARAESLAAAARALGVTPPAVTQRLQDLERRLGVRLVERSGRRVTLTAEGELLAARGQEIADDLASLTETLAARRGVVAGHLRVLAPLGFGRAHVAPAAGRFFADHAEVTLDLVLSDRMGRVAETSWDVAVHIGELRDSSLVATRLAPNDRILCASPSFVARYGVPDAPADLRDFACIALRENDEDVTMWRFARDDGAAESVRVEPRLATNDGEVVREWAVAGRGIIVRSEWSVAADLRAGRLARLLPGWRLPSADVIAFVGPRRGRSARATRFVEYLREALTPVPWRADS